MQLEYLKGYRLMRQRMTNKEALKIASWLVDDELCEEESEYCNKSCIECQREDRRYY